MCAGVERFGLQFNYHDDTRPPTLLGSTPISGPKAGGTPLRITGENFANTDTLTCSFRRPPEMCHAASPNAPQEVHDACQGADVSQNLAVISQRSCEEAVPGPVCQYASGTTGCPSGCVDDGVTCTAPVCEYSDAANAIGAPTNPSPLCLRPRR